ncbi:Rieske (2Fe-2S) protein [Natrinema gelatinilyticum]|uniref:Rieske (2Fe-2S) protein n=1 Tax=Natrinema gelatinilyticum TaxID=2961571 RepID=UPI0020C1CDF3|nr:Rieske 2Fe-2S domain-containing protein [Natrinema gelatinilyticum]
MVEIGPKSLLETTPCQVDVNGGRYLLHERNDSEIALYSAICPHQRGRVKPRDDVFLCPNHRWKFDPETGECLTGANETLPSVSVQVREDRLYADKLP